MRVLGVTKPTGTHMIFTKHEALHPIAQSEDYSSSGMLISLIKTKAFNTEHNKLGHPQHLCTLNQPNHASPRQESQRLRPLGHKGLMMIGGLIFYRIMGYKSIKLLIFFHCANEDLSMTSPRMTSHCMTSRRSVHSLLRLCT